jgi:hypothetical protein
VLIESLMKAGVSGSNRLCQVQSQPTPCVLDPFAIVWLSEEAFTAELSLKEGDGMII